MSIYTIVDKDICIACEACSLCAPDIFEHDASGLSQVMLDDNQGTVKVPENLIYDVEDAAEGCPVDAIKISDRPFNGSANKTDVAS